MYCKAELRTDAKDRVHLILYLDAEDRQTLLVETDKLPKSIIKTITIESL